MNESTPNKQKVGQELAKLSWNDRSISSYNPTTKKRLNINFKLAGNLKGLHLRYNPNTKSKTFVMIGKFGKKTFYHKCGEFQLGSTGTPEVEQYVNELVRKHKNRNGEWTSNPNEENITEEEVIENTRYRVRDGIERLHKESYPKVEYEGSIAEKSIRQYTQFHSGFNKRRDLLKFSTDPDGCGVLELKEGTWESYWKIYKPYTNTINDERSIYDSKLGAYYFDQLTPSVIEKWCNKAVTFGGRKNRLKAIQYLYSACSKLGLTPRDQLDPTRVKYNGVKLNKSKKKKSRVSQYNDISYSKDQLHKLIDTLWTLRDDYPFQTEAVLMICYSGRRQEETLKLTSDMLYRYKDQPHTQVITMPDSITKKRSEEYIVITEDIQKVLDSLEYQRNKPKFRKYKFIKALFPKANLNTLLCADVEWCRSDAPRYKNIETVWKKVVELTGIIGQKKNFRKTLATIGTELVGADKTIQITGHEDTKILLKNYNKPQIEAKIETAQQIAKVYNIKK
jgi:hypothetical protein